MLHRAYNSIVEFRLAVTQGEVEELIGNLPPDLARDMDAALERELTVYRYHSATKRAYFIERQGVGLVAWQWNDVRAVHEYGELMAAIVGLAGPLDDKIAMSIFERATGRSE